MCKLIKTQRLAGWLMLNGYTLLRMNEDKNNTNFDIYIFKKENGIEEMIDRYKEKYGRKEN